MTETALSPTAPKQIDPEQAKLELFREMEDIAATHTVRSLPETIEEITILVGTLASTAAANQLFRTDPHFRELGIATAGAARNLLPRQLHERLFGYLQRQGVEVTPGDVEAIQRHFKELDESAKRDTLQSYASNGILTLRSALQRGVLRETSATPGDFSSGEGREFLDNEEHANIRGYEITTGPCEDGTFYGSNGFIPVSLERGGEDINRASQLPKPEIENRAHASMMFLVQPETLAMSRRHENTHQEDVVQHDIPPAIISYVLVPESSAALAQEAFRQTAVDVIPVGDTTTELHDLYDGPYIVPDYKSSIESIVAAAGPMWCHIARLPVDTYPPVASTQ